MEVHIVVKGDTLWKIARQYNIPFEELKRVNAHLANPDYIVPGMKIFLPMDKKKPTHKGESSKPHDKTPQKPQQPSKPHQPEMKPPQPAPKPTPKPEKPHPPAQQVPPLPQMPQMPQRPQTPQPPQMPQLPQKPHTPQAPHVPVEPQTPPAPQMPMMPNTPSVPMWQAVFPICGWMPIFDADCHPHMPQQPPMQAPIKPLPPKAPTEWHDESSHHHHHHRPAPMPDGWQMIESSSLHVPIKPLPTPKPIQPKPPVAQPKPTPPKVEQPTPMPMPNQPSIPPKACTPASWCPSNQEYCFPSQPQWPMNTGCEQPMQMPMHWYPMPMPCYPPASIMPMPYPGPYPQQMQPPLGQQDGTHYPMPIQDDWFRNQ